MPKVSKIYFSGFSESQLKTMRTERESQLSKAMNGRITSTGKEGNSISKDLATIDELKTDLMEINAALKHLNPSIYGGGVKRLRANFSGARLG